jgi:predicted cupin superfamily sugar epimerase
MPENEMPVDPIADLSAAEIIRLLDLQPHPEGGHFRETFRDPRRDSRGRAVSTLIVSFLVPNLRLQTKRGFSRFVGE